MLKAKKRIGRPASLREGADVYFGEHRQKGRYFNPWRPMRQPSVAGVLRWKAQKNPDAARKKAEKPALPQAAAPIANFQGLGGGARLIWLGHASFYLETGDLRVIIDPCFGRAGALVPRLAPSPLGVDALPEVDAVLLTHGHYDHCDRPSLRALIQRFGPDLPIVTPVGLRYALPKRCRQVIELDWWEYTELRGIEIHYVPAQHWHRRTLNDTNRALWAGIVLRGDHTIYHAGDSGYFDGFPVIAETLGPPDLALLPIGAYKPRWFMHPQHMSPDESVEVWRRMGARHLVAMHWGTFDLTDEPLDEGPRDLARAIAEQKLESGRFHVLPHGGSLGWNGQGIVGPTDSL